MNGVDDILTMSGGALLPALVAVGHRLSRRHSVDAFRRCVYALIGSFGVFVAWRGIWMAVN